MPGVEFRNDLLVETRQGDAWSCLVSTDQLEDGGDRDDRLRLDIDIEAHAGKAGQNFLEGRDPGKAAVRQLSEGPALDVVECGLGNGPVDVGESAPIRIMRDDDLPIAGEVNIQLESVGPVVECALKRRKRVLR
jgi:hypothetical protein